MTATSLNVDMWTCPQRSVWADHRVSTHTYITPGHRAEALRARPSASERDVDTSTFVHTGEWVS